VSSAPDGSLQADAVLLDCFVVGTTDDRDSHLWILGEPPPEHCSDCCRKRISLGDYEAPFSAYTHRQSRILVLRGEV
jgi:hypothetical protein